MGIGGGIIRVPGPVNLILPNYPPVGRAGEGVGAIGKLAPIEADSRLGTIGIANIAGVGTILAGRGAGVCYVQAAIARQSKLYISPIIRPSPARPDTRDLIGGKFDAIGFGCIQASYAPRAIAIGISRRNVGSFTIVEVHFDIGLPRLTFIDAIIIFIQPG